MKKKKLSQKDQIKCLNYKQDEKKIRCEYLGVFSGRCFKNTNPLMPCKEIPKEKLNEGKS